ncbi:hypothetical protein HYR54_10360 [Candidatus Acetothermia bacterium]|nr:hypothetical protein [Candidatus Acetothermia bacterium]MBI3659251.1 hypothetical protein [Candidatus Acetothermia bacterium]
MKYEYALKLILLAVFLTLAASSGAFAEPQKLETLVIDETKTLEESVCVEFLARGLQTSGLFELEALSQIPREPNPSGKPYDLTVIVPEKILQVWLVTADIPARLPDFLQRDLLLIKEIVAQIYNGSDCTLRQAVDTSDDLAPALYAAVLLQNGWLQSPR